MKQIRKNVFETNSSSTHSIAIPKKVNNYVNRINFYLGEYGWEDGEANPANYLYTALICLEDFDRLEHLKEILDHHNIEYRFEEPRKNSWGYYDGNIDHSYELQDFLSAVFSDEELLLRYLTDGRVYMGNDNSNEYEDMCYCAYPTITNWDGSSYKKYDNPNHDAENYDYFFKGN